MSKRLSAKRHSPKHSVEALESRIAPAIIVVANNADAGPGSLRAAVASSAPGDEIDFDPSLSGQTITLMTGQIVLDHSLAIHGLQTGTITIDGDGEQRIFDVEAQGASIQIDHLTLKNGAAASGGAINVGAGALTVDHSIITGNTAFTSDGGGIYVTASAAAFVLSNSQVSGNQSADDGGGLCIYNTDSQVLNSTISGNTAGRNGGSGHNGGGVAIYQNDAGVHHVTVSNSTISGNNTSGTGGGVYAGGYLGSGNNVTLENCTISTNTSQGMGGGIELRSVLVSAAPSLAAQDSFVLRNSTVAFNETTGSNGAGIVLNGGTLTVQSTISSNNTESLPNIVAAGTPSDFLVNGGTANVDHSLIFAPFNGAVTNGVNNNITGVDPGLGTLQDNGGPTFTHAITSTSAAHDVGSNPASLEFDQRGAEFGRNSGAGPDIGAFEVQAVTGTPDLHITIADDITKTVPIGGYINYTITYSNTGTGAATNVVLHEVAGDNTYFSAAPVDAVYQGDGSYNLVLGTVGAGATGMLHFQAQLEYHPTSQHTTTNTATLTSDAQQTAADAVPNSITASVDSLLYQGIEVLTPAVAKNGQHGQSKVRIIDLALKNAGQEGAEIDFLAYGKKVRDSFRTTTFDLNGDGFDDVIILPEHGTGTVKVFDGTSGELLDSKLNGLQPFGKKTGGFVAAINEDLGEGGTNRVVYFGSSLGDGQLKAYDPDTGLQIGNTIRPFDDPMTPDKHYTGGIRLATGHVAGGFRTDLIAAEGNFGHTVTVFNGGDLGNVLGSFTTPDKYNGGFNVGAGDLNGDGYDEILLGHNRLSAPIVEIWSYQPQKLAAVGSDTSPFVFDTSFMAFKSKYKNGVRPTVGDLDLDGKLDILAATGYAGRSVASVFSVVHTTTLIPAVMINPEPIDTFKAFPKLPLPGVWASISNPLPTAARQFGFTG